MGDYTQFDLSTASHDGRWSRRGKFSNFRVWLPTNPAGGGNVSGYQSPPWKVVFYKHGGAKMNPDGLDLNTNTSAMKFVNDLGCVLISYDTMPGGFYEPTAQEPDAKYWPETHAEDAAFISWIRANATNETIFGTGGSITTDPALSVHWGNSSGGWDVVKTQLARDGEFDYASGAVQRGEARFAGKYGHTCNFVLLNQAQSILSTFTKSKVAATDPASSYTVNGSHSIGATTIAVTGGTGAWVFGNRLRFSSEAADYAVTEDKASGSGNLKIFPALRAGLSGGETIERQDTGSEKYGDHSWCGGYFFPSGQGVIWQSDTVSGASGQEFPWDIKRQADADVQCAADNPRVKGINWIFIGASGTEVLFTSALTGEQSFLEMLPAPYGTAADGYIHPAHNDLHNEAQSFALAYVLDALGNTSNVALYAGNATTNTTVGATNWNKGRNADFSSTVLAAFLAARSFT